MIRVIQHWGTESPQLFCDHCGARIPAAAEANVSWACDSRLGVPLDTAIVITHKRCTAAYEAAHGGARRWGFTDLSRFLLQLCIAAHVDWMPATTVPASAMEA